MITMLACPNCGVELDLSELGEVCPNCGFLVPLGSEYHPEEDEEVDVGEEY